MVDEHYTIRPAWPDALVYEESPERSLRLVCVDAREPPIVRVCDEARWDAESPAWARGLRARIVERLEAARCVVQEADESGARMRSPDGRVVVETESEVEERVGFVETLDVRDLRTGEVLAQVLSHGGPCGARFPEPGVVALTLHEHGPRERRVRIDVVRRTFTLDGGAEQPLTALPDELAYRPAAPYRAPPVLRSRLFRALNVRLSALFVVAGVWQLGWGDSLKDRALGALCALFFGACAWLEARDTGR